MKASEYGAFGEQFLNIYLQHGFGSLPKREIDLLVFHLLTRTSDYRNKTNYELATLLRIPEASIKSMRLASALKHDDLNPKAILGRVVLRLTDGGQIPTLVDGKVEISLEDPVEKREMVNFLKMKRDHAEYVLNSEVLRISPTRLLELIVDNMENADAEFTAIIQQCVKDNDEASKILSKANTTKKKLDNFRKSTLTTETVVTVLATAAQVFLAQPH